MLAEGSAEDYEETTCGTTGLLEIQNYCKQANDDLVAAEKYNLSPNNTHASHEHHTDTAICR
jgi:hypothetical protein